MDNNPINNLSYTIKTFYELTVSELWDIYNIRNKVFIVEQNCIYQDVDEYDKRAMHIIVSLNNEVIGYARVLPRNCKFEDISIGRIICIKRRQGIGLSIVNKAIDIAKRRYNAKKIVIEAQVYAVPLYEKAGFTCFGDEFIEDGIKHIHMEYKC